MHKYWFTIVSFFERVVSKKKWLKLKADFLNKQKEEIAGLKAKLEALNDQMQQKLSEKFNAKNNANIKIADLIRNCVLKLTLSLKEKEFEDFKLGKQEFKAKYLTGLDEHIIYFELEKNFNRIMIRCKSSESAKELLGKKDLLVQFNKCLLEGSEEIEYFEKIFLNRTKKQFKKEKKTEKKSTPKADLD